MAFENSQAFMVESKKLIKTCQFENNARIDAGEGKAVKKVLTVLSQAKITNKEKMGEVINFSGKIAYQVVYETTENTLASLVFDVDFQEKIEEVSLENVFLKARIMENNVTGFSASEIALASLVNVEVYGIVSDKVQSVENFSDDYVRLEKTFEYQRVVNFVSDSFNEVAEQEIQGKVQEVLCSQTALNVTNVVAGIDTVTVDGNVEIATTYIENGEVKTANKTVEFKREIASLSTVPSNLAVADLSLDMVKVTASVSDIDEKTNFVYSIEISACVTVFATDTATLTEDTFSTQKELNVSYECLEYETRKEMILAKDTVSVSASASQDAEELVLITAPEIEVTDKVQSENSLMITGAFKAEMIYLNENSESNVNSLMTGVSFEVLGASLQDEIEVNVKVLSAKLRSQKEVELTLEIATKTLPKEIGFMNFVNALEEKEDKQKNNSAIRVYVTREGEDLFAVSKSISIKPEVILEQNPNIDEKFVAGTKLIIYSPLDINF